MAIEYRLTLAANIPLEQVAKIAAPGATDEPTPAGNRLLSAELYEECGYLVSITAGRHGYYDADDDDGSLWVWEPESYVDINFRMSKNDLSDRGVSNMLATVDRVLANRTEDAALVLNGNWLLLTRVAGKTRKHASTWWSHHIPSDTASH